MEKLLTVQELGQALAVGRTFLLQCRQNGMPYLRLGPRCIRYRLSDVLAWFAENPEGYLDIEKGGSSVLSSHVTDTKKGAY